VQRTLIHQISSFLEAMSSTKSWSVLLAA